LLHNIPVIEPEGPTLAIECDPVKGSWRVDDFEGQNKRLRLDLIELFLDLTGHHSRKFQRELVS
jgi:hypothetical protein